MPEMTVDQIDEMRRRGDISWEDYAKLLRGHMELLRSFPGERDRNGRLRELEDLGGYERWREGEAND